MPQAQSADGVIHDFPEGIDPAVMDRAMKQYAQSKPQGAGAAPATAGSRFENLWDTISGAAQGTAKAVAGSAEALWDRVGSGGNILGLPGKSALDRSAEFDVPYKPGMKAGQMIPPNWQENPMLGAFGTGNIGRGVGPRNPAATARLQDFEGQGITPNIPAVGQGRAAGLAAQASRILPFSPVQRGIAQNTVEAQAATERAASQYGTAADEFAGGNVARNAMTRFAADKSQAASDYGTFFGHMQGAPDAPIPNTLRVLSDFKGRFPNDLVQWANFTGSCQYSYLGKEECVGGSWNIETRYPFLDTAFVQSFLSLAAELKNRNYKAPLFEYMTRTGFPFQRDVKIGWAA